ncbi:MAG TPA: aminotransferase class I/II-fold pyridoxal phosphate-dependent enzyme [Thermoleophilia bacterium]|nr:aminotransferase class I/II-fold pyridoxal phosphate-dependent enzyme [Thermoleophilia bacterium]HQG03027.1 aminotransferase class I/II-fold pyridoxal phosphate-dependent enzyme [Thermoleophilia bacterium]HQG54522.1 aminotransferase class I/II-fold pyridoxal phosphate-dependent enzyme [Thermoleophilia bacterium]HQJ98533.1 aminotransferase class I/II-fold pyridoxal phosphate-dependent enzyme [Thermoleophilia bacterium]
MELRRIDRLPPYVFTAVDEMKIAARRHGEDIIDLGMGNPDLPTPSPIVDKLVEAARHGRNHRYSASRGITKLRLALSDWYRRRFGVEIDPECEAVVTIGAKEGLAHLMWVLVRSGDTALVPEPTYPIHQFSAVFAGAEVNSVPLTPDTTDFFADLQEAYDRTWPRPRVILVSFPHNPTGHCVDLGFFERLVRFARENDVFIVHDFAYAEIVFDGYEPPSILQVPGAKDVAVEFISLSKSHSMPGWRIGFAAGNAEVIAGLQRLKSYLDYGVFQPIQIAAIIALNECDTVSRQVAQVYQRRRDVLCDGLTRVGWPVERPKGTMFVWAPIPGDYRELGSLEFSKLLLTEARVAVSPGVGFGRSGDGFVRFALVENEERIRQGVQGIKRAIECADGRRSRR